jgi:NADH-quinone oxidoreductase subunit G
MSDNEVTLTIDGKSVTVPKGTKVVDAARQVAVDIPVFCYHEKIGPLGCCRMCLVEVEKMPKLMTACTMDVAPDMVVKTTTDKVEEAQKGVLEFTLLNHPLDCPVCDKGGECPLQDNTFKYGPPDTRMEFHRANNAKATPLSPVITIDRERCIACQRCTAYSERIEQDQGLVMLNRGFHNEVGTFNNVPYDNRFSGNVIDICPVGALTNTEFRFKARTWDLTNADTLCANCGCNCNITMGTRLNELMRIEARPNDAVDDGWICDKGRWGHQFVQSKNKILTARENSMGTGKMTSFPTFPHDCTAEDAAGRVAEAFKEIAEEYGPQSIGFIGSPYGTNEENYLYQKFFRQGLGSNNIDHKTYQDTPGLPVSHYGVEQIETSNVVLLIASDPTEELPILDLRIKKAVTGCGTRLVSLNDQRIALDRYSSQSVQYKVGSEALAIDALANGLAKELGEPAPDAKLDPTGISEEDMKSLVETVRSSMKICVVYNPSALSGDAVVRVKRLLKLIAKVPTMECGAIPAAQMTNAVGAMDMGLVPNFYPGGVSVADQAEIKKIWGETTPTGAGLSALEMIARAEAGELKALLVHRSNPVLDFPGGATRITEALKNLELLVVHDMLETETTELAHLVLSSNGPGYDEGTTTNIGGRVQARAKAFESSQAADWKIINMMLKALGDDTEYRRVSDVTEEISQQVPGYQEISKGSVGKAGCDRGAIASGDESISDESWGAGKDGTFRLRNATFLFAHDKILDASSKLAHHFQPSTAYLNGKDAESLGIKDGDTVLISAESVNLEAVAKVSDRCKAGGVVVPRVSDEQGINGLAGMDGSPTFVSVRKV